MVPGPDLRQVCQKRSLGVQDSGQTTGISKAVALIGKMRFTLRWTQVCNLLCVTAERSHRNTCSHGHRSVFNIFHSLSLMFTKSFQRDIPFFTLFK